MSYIMCFLLSASLFEQNTVKAHQCRVRTGDTVAEIWCVRSTVLIINCASQLVETRAILVHNK